jgi:hypothetical protein
MKIRIKKPSDVTLLIQEGQKVDLQSPFYDKNLTDTVKIPLATILKFPPNKIFMVLHKLVGESIHKGDVLADYKGIFGIREYISEHTGTIAEINHYDGSITINVQSESTNTIHCSFVGEINEVTGDVITLKVKEGKEFPIDQVSHYMGGPVFYYHDDTKGRVTEDSVQHALIVAEDVPSYDQIKMEALGARGFITIHGLTEKTKLPTGRVAKKQDYESIVKAAYPYCVIGTEYNTMTFYK